MKKSILKDVNGRSESTCNMIRKIVKEELEHQEQNMIEI